MPISREQRSTLLGPKAWVGVSPGDGVGPKLLAFAIMDLGRKVSYRSGFTLVELLVVIAIVAILAAMLMPSLAKAKAKGQMAVCAANQRQLAIAAITYSLDYNEWMSPLQDVRTGPDGRQ